MAQYSVVELWETRLRDFVRAQKCIVFFIKSRILYKSSHTSTIIWEGCFFSFFVRAFQPSSVARMHVLHVLHVHGIFLNKFFPLFCKVSN